MVAGSGSSEVSFYYDMFQVDKKPIDLQVCRQQHADLVAALRANGIDVLELPPEESNPLSVFTQVASLSNDVPSTFKKKYTLDVFRILQW